jgi:hypothetical protein
MRHARCATCSSKAVGCRVEVGQQRDIDKQRRLGSVKGFSYPNRSSSHLALHEFEQELRSKAGGYSASEPRSSLPSCMSCSCALQFADMWNEPFMVVWGVISSFVAKGLSVPGLRWHCAWWSAARCSAADLHLNMLLRTVMCLLGLHAAHGLAPNSIGDMRERAGSGLCPSRLAFYICSVLFKNFVALITQASAFWSHSSSTELSSSAAAAIISCSAPHACKHTTRAVDSHCKKLSTLRC